jgi:transposase InsO family protein
MERLFRSLKTEWVPTTGYMTAGEAHRDISYYLMQRYNWIRPHQFNHGVAPAVAEEKLNPVSGASRSLHPRRNRSTACYFYCTGRLILITHAQREATAG